MKYLEEDLEAIAKKQKTIKQVAEEYGVSQNSLLRILNMRGYHLRKRKIRIRTPYKTVVVGSIQECAETLKLSTQSIRNALKGQRVKTLEDLHITVEVVKK